MVGLARKITEIGSQRREHILRAAETEFEKYGFNGARMQRIADTAGVPKANIQIMGRYGLWPMDSVDFRATTVQD